MSDIRAYLLTVDNDKRAAEEIASGTARSKSSVRHPIISEKILNDMYRPRVTSDDID